MYCTGNGLLAAMCKTSGCEVSVDSEADDTPGWYTSGTCIYMLFWQKYYMHLIVNCPRN